MLAFTDSDCFPTAGWLTAGAAALEAADLVQGAVLPDPDVAVGPFDRTLWVVARSASTRPRTCSCGASGSIASAASRTGLPRALARRWPRTSGLAGALGAPGARTVFSDEALVHHAVFGAIRPATSTSAAASSTSRRWSPRCPSCARRCAGTGAFLSKRTAAFDLALAGRGRRRGDALEAAAAGGAALRGARWRRARDFGRRRAPGGRGGRRSGRRGRAGRAGARKRRRQRRCCSRASRACGRT